MTSRGRTDFAAFKLSFKAPASVLGFADAWVGVGSSHDGSASGDGGHAAREGVAQCLGHACPQGDADEGRQAVAQGGAVVSFRSRVVAAGSLGWRQGADRGFFDDAFHQEKQHEDVDHLLDELRSGAVEVLGLVADLEVAEGVMDKGPNLREIYHGLCLVD